MFCCYNFNTERECKQRTKKNTPLLILVLGLLLLSFIMVVDGVLLLLLILSIEQAERTTRTTKTGETRTREK
jgi:hypothetical protein